MNDKYAIDILYICGYVDGDGCFHISLNSRKANGRIDICSTNEHVLFGFARSFGGTVRISGKAKTSKQKPTHHFSIGGKNARNLAAKMIPHLLEKRNQAMLFVSFFETKSIEERKKIIQRMHQSKNKDFLVTRNDVDILKETPKTTTITEGDFPYLAGFIDAECSLGIQHYRPAGRPNTVYKIILQCNNTKSNFFYWIKSRLGGSVHFVRRNTTDSRLRDQILWKLTGKSVYDILKQVHPFLKYKKPVAEKLIEFYQTTLPNGGDRQSKSFKEDYQRVLCHREAIVLHVHDLNRKGV